MELEKTNRINALFDFYEELLTNKQMQYIGSYYRDDYSLGEIAENFDVSRQAVYDNIKKHLDDSLMLVTALNSKIGYYKAAAIAQKAFKEGKTLKQAAIESGEITEEEYMKKLKLTK